MPEQRQIIDLSGRQLFNLLMSLLIDTGYGDEDGHLTPLGEEYLLTIREEEEVKTFDVALTTVHNLSTPEQKAAPGFMHAWDNNAEADDEEDYSEEDMDTSIFEGPDMNPEGQEEDDDTR